MMQWVRLPTMPKSGYFLTAHPRDGAWVPEIAWWEPKAGAFIIDSDGTPLRMEARSVWADINYPES